MEDSPELREDAVRRIKAKRGFWRSLVAYIIVNAILVAIWANGDGGAFWPGIVMFFWGVALIGQAWRAFATKPITEKDIRREMGEGA